MNSTELKISDRYLNHGNMHYINLMTCGMNRLPMSQQSTNVQMQ